MTPERWQHIDKLFHSALERRPEERASFLTEACGGDDSMRCEVEALIAAHERSGEFLDAPAFAVGSEKLTIERDRPAANQRVGHYRILGPLGAGGMGEVYLAEDSKLRRKIALKLLPGPFTQDAERLRRFEQEARAASVLSHPNICVIHEIGETEDKRNYIAMEYIEGVTLRQRLAQKRLKLIEALDVAIQIAAGLAVAHAAGIIHRDIKPENVMLRADGLVKLLDFGLAKLTERQSIESDTESLLRSMVQTGSGTIMGTVAYMSPEQARGLRVDARSDIWSLGVVLYEMVSGQPPFAGPTPSDLLVSILDREPLPLSRQSGEVPAELERIVRKALEKDTEERYQVVKDLALDLKSLRRELEREAEQERSPSTEASGGKRATAFSGQMVVATARESIAGTNEIVLPYPTTSAEYLVNEIKRHKTSAMLLFAGLVIVLVGLAYGLYKFIGTRTSIAKSTLPFQSMKATRLTSAGNALRACVSPDGKYVAYVLDEDGQQSLWIRQVAIASNIRLVPPAEVQYTGLTFSKDGNYIYYVVSNALFQIPLLGGSAKKLLGDYAATPISFSPDGKRMAFVRGNEAEKEDQLIIANADGTGEQKLAVRKYPATFGWFPYSGPAWSPDGRIIACLDGGIADGVTYTAIVTVRVEGGGEKPITSQQRWEFIGQIVWLSDGSGLLLTARDHWSSYFQIWHLTYPGGEARRVTGDLSNYWEISSTTDSKMLVMVQRNRLDNVWLAPSEAPDRATRITPGAGTYQLSWTPDGKIVYGSSTSGTDDIWMMEADGTGQKQLTNGEGKSISPSVSPDGRYIVFHSNRSGTYHIWRMNIDGSDPRQLTHGNTEATWPSCSPDSQWVVYSYGAVLWKMPIGGGDPVQLNDRWSSRAVFSPDGKLIAYWHWDTAMRPRIEVISVEGGQPLRTFDVPQALLIVTGVFAPPLHWSPDGRALVYTSSGGKVSNLWSSATRRRQARTVY